MTDKEQDLVVEMRMRRGDSGRQYAELWLATTGTFLFGGTIEECQRIVIERGYRFS